MAGKNQKIYTAPKPSNYAGPGAGQGTKMRPEMEKLISKSEKINPGEFYDKNIPESGFFIPNRPERSTTDYGNPTRKRNKADNWVANYVPDLGPPKILVDGIIGAMDYLDKRKGKKSK
jgi:hypothetical protein